LEALTLVVEAQRQANVVGPALSARCLGCPTEVLHIARKAQQCLHRKFWRMVSRNKSPKVAIVAVARELAGFVWAISQHFPGEAVA